MWPLSPGRGAGLWWPPSGVWGAGRVLGKPSSAPNRRTSAEASGRAGRRRRQGLRGDWGQALGLLALRTALPHPPLGGLSAPTGRALARASGPLPASAPPARAALPLQNWAAPGPGRKCPPAPPRPALSCFPRWPLEASLSSVTPACPSPPTPGAGKMGASIIHPSPGLGAVFPPIHINTRDRREICPFQSWSLSPQLCLPCPFTPLIPIPCESSLNSASPRPRCWSVPQVWGGGDPQRV